MEVSARLALRSCGQEDLSGSFRRRTIALVIDSRMRPAGKRLAVGEQKPHVPAKWTTIFTDKSSVSIEKI